MSTLLALMMAFCTNFEANPHFTQHVPGQYIEMVYRQYDSTHNQTYVILDRYSIDTNGYGAWVFMQPRPFTGQPTDKQVMDSIEADSYVTVVGK